MDLEQLKEKLDDETFEGLTTFVNDLIGQRDSARNESIQGRKGLKEKLSQYEAQQAELMERLGIESFEDIDAIPDAKGAAEAAKQYEVKVKRLERQLQETKQYADEMSGKYRNSLMRAQLADALGGHEFVAKDVVETYVGNRLTWEGDDLLFKTDEGNLVSVKDGVSAFAKSRPELLKPTGAGGAGVRSANAGSKSGQQTITRAEFEAMNPSQKLEIAKGGVTIQ